MIEILFSSVFVHVSLAINPFATLQPSLELDQRYVYLASNDLKSTANYGDMWERRQFGVTKGNSGYGGGSHPANNIKSTANYGDMWERRQFGVLKGNSDYGGGSHPANNIKSTANYGDMWERRQFGVLKGNSE